MSRKCMFFGVWEETGVPGENHGCAPIYRLEQMMIIQSADIG